MNRRNFIVNTILFLMASTINAKTNFNKTFSMYIDESGIMGDSYNPFVIGALTINSNYDNNIVNKIKKESGFNLQMKYKSSNKYKLDLINPLLQEFFKSDKMKFSALVFPYNINEQWPSEKKHGLSLYKYNYKNLLTLASNKNMKLNIYLSKRMSIKEDENLKQFLEQKFKNINIQLMGDKDDNSNEVIAQFTDVLTGSIYGDITRTRDITKQKTIHYIKSLLNVEELHKDINFKSGKFVLKINNKI